MNVCRVLGHKVDRPDLTVGKPHKTTCPRCGRRVVGYPRGTFKRLMNTIREARDDS